MSGACKKLHRSRAAYYKACSLHDQQLQGHAVLQEMVRHHRSDMPRLGGRKLLSLMREDLGAQGLSIGRDRFFSWLAARDLLVPQRKCRARTTNSRHPWKTYQNRVKGMDISAPDQVWVSDITYLRLQKGFCYLALVTDAYSRKIVGYDVSTSLELSGCLRALKRACQQRQDKSQPLIHHSDRGSQYCSARYVDTLKRHGIHISMAEAGNCYENAQAERVNGILKTEFLLDQTFRDLKQAQAVAAQAIHTYNCLRPHMALGMRKPQEVYAA